MRNDIRDAIRGLKSSPGFTAVALLVLTLGIGASTAIFSLVDAVVLRGLPFDESDRLVSVALRNSRTGRLQTVQAPQDFADWQMQQDVFSAFVATTGMGSFIIRDGDYPESLRVSQVTADFFDVFRAMPKIGRPFTKDNQREGNHRVAVISDRFWRGRFGADPDVLGKTMTFDSGSWSIIGVMPPGFPYPVGSSRPTDMWVPFAAPEEHKQRGNSRNYYLSVIGRLKDGVSIEMAQARLQAITAGLAEQFPSWFEDPQVIVRSLHESLVGRVRSWMLMLLGAVGFVLLIACVNVANLMLARGAARNREIQIRAALGASRWQIGRGLLAESLVLSTAGTACGLVVAWWGVSILRSALPQYVPRIASVGIDFRVLGAAAFAALMTGVVFGLVPALRFSRPNLAGALQDGGRGTVGSSRQWLRSSLVIAEVALAVVLLVGAGLFVSSFVRLVSVDIGLDYRNVLTVGVYPTEGRNLATLEQEQERAAAILPEILDRVKAIPGVQSAGVISGGLPLSRGWSRTDVRVPGRGEPFSGDDSVDIRRVTPDYGRAIRAQLRLGRYIEETDREDSAPVVVLNVEAVRRYLGERDPIGAQITINGDRTVVGVVADVRLGGPESEVRPEAYVPMAQVSVIGGVFVIRTAGHPLAILDAVYSAIRASLPDTAKPNARTMESLLDRLIAQREFNMLLVGLFGLLAIVIAAVGIYGVMAYTVAQRTQEIGVRMALGALPGEVLRMVLARATLFMALGLTVGLASAWMLASSIEAFLFQVQPHDLTVYASAASMLFLSGLLAAFVPARRAARVDPLIALRTE